MNIFKSVSTEKKDAITLGDDLYDFEPSPTNSQEEEVNATVLNPKKRKYAEISSSKGDQKHAIYDEFASEQPT